MLIHNHNRASFQFGFLCLGGTNVDGDGDGDGNVGCIVFWTVLRVFYFSGCKSDDGIPDLILYWYPIDIQFATFSLIVVRLVMMMLAMAMVTVFTNMIVRYSMRIYSTRTIGPTSAHS